VDLPDTHRKALAGCTWPEGRPMCRDGK